jgi:hypothetical protein
MENVANAIIEEIGKAQTKMDAAKCDLDGKSGATREYFNRQVSFYRGMIIGLEKAYFADGIQNAIGNTRQNHVDQYRNEVGDDPDTRERDRQNQYDANRNSPQRVSERGYSVN